MNTPRTPRRPPQACHGRLVFRQAQRPGELACWIALPHYLNPRLPALVAVHGLKRGAQQQAELFGQAAAEQGRVVIAPLFDSENFPRYQRLAHGAAPALHSLLSGLAAELGLGSALARFHLFGFSGGAQFAHRFAMLCPQRVSRLSLASAGWYTFADAEPFPYGLGGQARPDSLCARMRLQLDQFLQLPIDVFVGERDTDRDANTRVGAAIDRQQGRHRRARAARWSDAIAIEAAVRGLPSQVRFSVLPASGHDFERCVRRGGLAGLVLHEPLHGRLQAPPHAPCLPREAAGTAMPFAGRLALPAGLWDATAGLHP